MRPGESLGDYQLLTLLGAGGMGEVWAAHQQTLGRRVPPTMMAGYDGRIPDGDIWSIVNYLRTLRPGK